MKIQWTIPNILTIFRIICVGFMIGCFCLGQRYWALGFFLTAGITDLIDGYLARHLNQITNFGKIMDPVADKLMIFSAAVAFSIDGVLPRYVPIIIFIKEMGMLMGALFFFRRKKIVVFSNYFGKFAAFFMFCAVLLSFFHEWVDPIHLWLVNMALLCTVAALVQYAFVMMKLSQHHKDA